MLAYMDAFARVYKIDSNRYSSPPRL